MQVQRKGVQSRFQLIAAPADIAAHSFNPQLAILADLLACLIHQVVINLDKTSPYQPLRFINIRGK